MTTLFFWQHILSTGLFCLLAAPALLAQDQISPALYDQVTASFQQGKLSEAEHALRSALRNHPREARALSLLGVILDSQKRYEEAERCYTQALEIAPSSAALQNNLGNHYLARGMPDRARVAFLRVVALEPRHPNANLQLAQMSVAKKKGREALLYLERLTGAERAAPAVQLLRAQALYWSGQQTSAEELLSRLGNQAPGDSRLAFSIGMVFVEWERFEEAERAFTRALEAAPTNFDVLYNLALAATRARHLGRAEEVFKVALQQRPADVDCLYGLAHVNAERGQDYEATALLLQAQRFAPQRSDIPLLLAQMTEKLGFYGDAATAYDQYLKLQPNDDVARREHGYALARSGKLREGLRDLEWYARNHPKEVRGLYELAMAETLGDREKAIEHLNQALKIDSNFLPARYARAVLNSQGGRPAESLEDLEFFLKHEPKSVRALDQLGQAYLLLDQPQEAANALSQATELDPRDPTVLIRYSRALRKLGRKEEAETVLARFKQIGPDQGGRARAGLFDYFKLSPAEQQAQLFVNLERSAKANPKDTRLKLRLAKAWISQDKAAEALEIFREIRALTTDASLLADCGKALLEYGQYDLAREFLEPAVEANPSMGEPRLDLAIAVFHSAGPGAGLLALDKMPAEQRQGDYYLLRAQMLDASGRFKEAAETLNRGFLSAPTRADLYHQASLFLIKHEKYNESLELLKQAVKVLPNAPELLLTQAITLELLKQPEEAKKLLTQIQSRWPEWDLPYLIHGIILEIHLYSEEAKAQLETAIALGTHDPAAFYYLALAIKHTAPEDPEGAQRAISEAVKLSPEDPYIRSLAGTIALARKEYAAAVEHLTAAIQSKPTLVEAHYALSTTYRAIGNMEKSKTELKEAQRLEKENPGGDPEPSPVQGLLFTVRAPGKPPS
jgi:tetratricopeptide (TPR) repeat protein